MPSTEEVALAVGVTALVVSFVSLWLNSLSSFKLRVFHTPPSFRLYTITSDTSGDEEGNTWWIPSFDLGFTFQNLGKRSGIVFDVRVVMEFSGPPAARKDVFYPVWVVDYPKFQKSVNERSTWIDNAIQRDWYSLLLQGSEAVQLHMVLETQSWDEKHVGLASVAIQVRSSKPSKWVNCCKVQLPITEDLYDSGSSISPEDTHLDAYRAEAVLAISKG